MRRRSTTTRSHPSVVLVFEEKASSKLAAQEVDRLGRNLLEGLLVLTDPFERGVSVEVLEGIAVGEYTEPSLILDLALALAKDHRREISRKTKNGLDAARKRGKAGGRPRAIDGDKRAVILARREKGESMRVITRVLDVSVGTVHEVLTEKSTRAASLSSFLCKWGRSSVISIG
jgi:DNA invertase Pin-like site-specific DNA recombinase